MPKKTSSLAQVVSEWFGWLRLQSDECPSRQCSNQKRKMQAHLGHKTPLTKLKVLLCHAMSQLLEAQLLALLGVRTNSGKPNPKHNRRGWEQKVHPGIWYYQNIPKPFNHLEGEWNGMEWIDPEKRERFEKSKRYKKQKSEFRQFDAKAPIQRSNIFFIIMLAELFGCWYADLEKLTFSRGYLQNGTFGLLYSCHPFSFKSFSCVMHLLWTFSVLSRIL